MSRDEIDDALRMIALSVGLLLLFAHTARCLGQFELIAPEWSHQPASHVGDFDKGIIYLTPVRE